MRNIKLVVSVVMLLSANLGVAASADAKRLNFLQVQSGITQELGVQAEILSATELTERLRSRLPGEMLGVDLIPHARGYIYQLQRRDLNGRLRTDFVDANTGDTLSRLTVQQLLAGDRYYTF